MHLTGKSWLEIATTLPDYIPEECPNVPFIIRVPRRYVLDRSMGFATTSIDLYVVCALGSVFANQWNNFVKQWYELPATDESSNIITRALLSLQELQLTIATAIRECSVWYTKYMPVHWTHHPNLQTRIQKLLYTSVYVGRRSKSACTREYGVTTIGILQNAVDNSAYPKLTELLKSCMRYDIAEYYTTYTISPLDYKLSHSPRERAIALYIAKRCLIKIPGELQTNVDQLLAAGWHGDASICDSNIYFSKCEPIPIPIPTALQFVPPPTRVRDIPYWITQ